MTASVELVLLKCLQCATAVPAEEDEVAWVCATCGQGLQLADSGLAAVTVTWAASAGNARPERWRPFWVFTGTVSFDRRESYSGRGQPDRLWDQPVRLYVPAYACTLQEMETLGAALTRQQLPLRPGPAAGPLKGCTLLPEDARVAIEFVVLTLEAERKDMLRAIDVRVSVGAPELWVVPFVGEKPVVAR